MFKNRNGAFKRVFALMVSVLMLAAQLVLPVAALAQDLSLLPEVTLYYMVGEEQHSVSVSADLYGEQPVYWAQLPSEAMGADVTLEIVPASDEQVTFNSTHGFQFRANEATAVDESFVTAIEVYVDGGFMGSCPLYLSTESLPEYEEEEEEDEPVYYDPQPVTATYYDQDGNSVAEYTEYVGMEGYTFDPYNHLPEGYTLLTTDGVYVYMDENGHLSQTAVEFRVEKEQVYYDPQPVTATYYDQDGNSVAEYTEYVGMEGYTFDPYNHLPEGYTLLTTDGVYVYMDENGNLSQTSVEFRVEKIEQPEEPEQPDYPEEPEQPDEPVIPDVPVTVDADVTVQYVADSVIYEEMYTLQKGQHTIEPNALLVESLGYQLASTDAVTVESYGDGTASINPVVFYVTAIEVPDEPEDPEQPETPEQPEEPEQPEVPDGVTVLEEMDCEGETTTKGLNVRSGPSKKYEKVFKLSKTGTVVQVRQLVQNEEGGKWYAITHEGRDGYASAEYIQLIEKKPIEAPVTFRYVDEEGATLYDPQTVTLGEGTHETAAYAMAAPADYTYSHASAETVVVSENGADPAEVIFTYQQVKPVVAGVTFFYLDDQGQTLMHERTETLEAGSYNAMAFCYEAPGGYTYSHATAETIVVDENGANPDSVTFTYAKNPPVEIKADVTFRYVNEDGAAVLDAYTETFGEGTHDVSAYAQSVEGYELIGPDAYSVTVDANGASPDTVTFTYRRQPVQRPVTFLYQSENGEKLLENRTEMLGEGTHESRSFAVDIQGYSYVSASAESITVGVEGAFPAEIVFTYAKIPAEASVGFSFVDQNGDAVPGLDSYTQTLSEGTYDTTDFVAAAPRGYSYSHPSDAAIVVDAEGAHPDAVTFHYTKLPTEVVVPILYLDGDRNPVMAQEQLVFDADDFGKTFDTANYAPGDLEGYNYAGVNSDTLTIDAMGSVSPQAIEFLYVLRPKAEASVTFEYICDGRAVASPLTVKLPEGENDVMEYAAYPDGYNYLGVSSQTVTVTPDGKANPSVVTFTYEKKSTTAELKVHYRTSIGAELPGSPEIRKLEAGEHTVLPNADYVPSGYNLSGNTQSYQVSVGSDLVAYPNSVTFTYYDASIKGRVTVNYYDSETSKLIVSETRELSPGSYTLEPNTSLVASKGKYVLSDVLTDTRVEVKENGETVPSSVSFYFKPEGIEVYQGYLLVTRQTAMRKELSVTSNAVMALPVDTVLWTAGQYQSGSITWNSAQTVVGSEASGFVNDADVRRISKEEAQARIEEYNEQHSRPEQNEGYYITIMDSVPLRRYMDTAAQAKYLKKNTVVYVSAQEYDENGYLWHETTYDKVTGYVRDGQLRKLTPDEVDEYLSAGNPIEPGSGGGSQYDPNGESSYGYVTKNSVNFRSSPNGTKIKALNKYGMALILGTREVSGVTWYNVNYSGQTGWIHGDYFHQMTLTEFTSFLNSDEYYQGITNNAAPSSTKPPVNSSTGSATQGNVSSVEDWNVGQWQNPNLGPQASYQPFNPYATPVATLSPKGEYQTETAGVKLYDMASTAANATSLPKDARVEVTGTVTMNGKTWYTVVYNGKTGYMETGVSLKQAAATATPEPTSTFVIGTMIPINYEDESKETQTGTVPWGLIAGAVVLVGGAGGMYAYALNQNKRRKAAAARAAASRRAQAAAGGAAAAGATSPYARRAVAAAPGSAQQRPEGAQQPYGSRMQQQNPYPPQTPYTSAQQSYQQPAYRPYGQMQESAANPYARPQQPQPRPYSAPVSAGTEESKPVSSNPYARPIGSVPSYSQGSTQDSAAAPRRRATRMQRYHDAEDGENNE